MKIQKIIEQRRRDFTAIFECEHCGETSERRGYDDSYFHNNVIPKMSCDNCNKTADDNYRPLTTKYPDSQTV